MSELLRIEGLQKRFSTGALPWRRHHVIALDDVSISIDRGRTLGLVGGRGVVRARSDAASSGWSDPMMARFSSTALTRFGSRDVRL
jgi:ABC-type antimicrobial peptide transport system ATPase subunit